MKKINIFLLLILSSCNIVPPTISWEDLSEEHDQQLNILGVITSSSDDDSLNTSFVKVHRSLQVDEASDSLVRYIDENGESRIKYESSYIVKDAEVILSNSNRNYKFNYYKEKYIGSDCILFTDSYFYDGLDFKPNPQEEWNLTVSTPSGLLASGKTIIPINPSIYTENLPDTFNILDKISFEWLPIENNQILNISNFLSYTGLSFFYGIDEEDSCSFTKEFIIHEESNIEYDLGSCKYLLNDDWPNDDFLMINLMSLDSNYYNYFINENNQDNEFSNLVVGTGSVPKTYGLEKGIGVFGSIGFDRHFIKIR